MPIRLCRGSLRCAASLLVVWSGSFGAATLRAQAADSAAVTAVVDRFHGALAAGDSSAALALLASDALIVESGDIESRTEYRAHHLPADIAFARAVYGERRPVRVVVRGDVAWVISASTVHGEFRGRTVDASGAELMVLSREGEGWKIRSIHWSSRSRRAPS